MIIYTDSEVFLLKKEIIKKISKIEFIKKIEDFNINDFENLRDDFVLILLSATIYKKTFYGDEFEDYYNFIINKFKNIINFYSEKYINVIIPLVPFHYLYEELSIWEQTKDNSHFKSINKVNNYIIENFLDKKNIHIINGIKYVSEIIRKDYFRFQTIYNKENSIILIEQISKLIKQVKTKKKKLIITDLDNTLWKGVIGEDSKDGIRMCQNEPIGSIYSWVQRKLLSLKKAGFLIAICSKNDENIALDGLFNNKDSLFRKEDIVTHRINWENKSKNVNEILYELNISANDAIFIDDNLHECDEVNRNCPGITTIIVPQDIYRYPEVFNQIFFYTDRPNILDNDRTKLYMERSLRKKLIDKSHTKNNSKDEWIKSLKINIFIEKINNKNNNLNRIVQLFNRTNQFNINGKVYNVKKFIDTINIPSNNFFLGNVTDRIGDEGIVTILGFDVQEEFLIITDYILSCRVFGRYIEKMILLPVLTYAKKNELIIHFDFKDTGRNKFARTFLSEITDQTYSLDKSKINNLLDELESLPIASNYINN